jgi:hypothetical protein
MVMNCVSYKFYKLFVCLMCFKMFFVCINHFPQFTFSATDTIFTSTIQKYDREVLHSACKFNKNISQSFNKCLWDLNTQLRGT